MQNENYLQIQKMNLTTKKTTKNGTTSFPFFINLHHQSDSNLLSPFKKATIEDSPLSFLPAPKRDPSAIIEDQQKENEKKIRAIEKPTIPTPSITEQQQQQPVKIVPKEESEQDKIKKEKQQQLQRQKSQQKQQFFRNLVSNSVTTPVPAQKQDVETPLPEAEPEMQPQQEV